MTKAELIDQVHGKLGSDYTKKQVGELIEAVFETAGAAIKGGRFSFPGFGTFTVKARKAREGRNPRTGKTIKIKASKSVGFKPAPKLKESL
jgi:DNA-binding protein HU-beta